MTFSDLKTMLQQDFNRSDKETVWYPIWINRALRKIQTDSSFSFMKVRSDLTISAGNSSVAMPARFKELTAEQSPVTIVDPSLSGPLAEVPCEVTSREKMIGYRASTFVPSRPANVRGRLSGLPVFVEPSSSGWTLNILDQAAENLNFRVSHFEFTADLVNPTDTNYLTVNYPDLVENKIKAIAFQSVNDPVAVQFEIAASKLLAEAVLDDQRRGTRGRVLRMGG